ncbi:serine hydrolase domain-containing protein [Phenylobacterium sp.]|uniref:serine hydrolase domain-containing protein n=1 Tax=Phenylobacterium sp. TaxID=1871053 RepID=UPI002F403B57
MIERTVLNRRTLLAAAALGGLGCGPATGGTMKGFTDQGLARLETTLKDHVARGSAPGLVALVSRGGETHAFALGAKALDGKDPVRRDTMFRLASMTKPITATAVMMLVEEGKLRLDEPVDRLLPELASRRVLKRIDGPLDETVPAVRPITVEDLLTFRLGWGIVFSDQPFPILKAVEDLPGFGMPNPDSPLTFDAWMARLSALPLMAQPGERWLYTVGSNVQGVLVARASGQALPAFFQDRILGPLGMTDSGFFAPPGKVSRLATGYMPQDGKLTLFDPPAGMYSRPPAFPAGDSGLVSTADDYAAFARFLTSGRTAGGKRLLSEASLKAMRTDHLTPAQRAGGEDILGPARGWGYGMGVTVEPKPGWAAPGAYGWDGGFGTSFFNDPAQGLTAILLTQRVFDGPDPPMLHKDFWKGAYVALA